MGTCRAACGSWLWWFARLGVPRPLTLHLTLALTLTLSPFSKFCCSGFYFLAMYLFISASFEFFSLGALFYAAYK